MRDLSIGWITALIVVSVAVAFEWWVMRVPLEWGLEGTFLLVALLASLAYGTGAIWILCAALFAGLRRILTTKVFLCLGVLAPLLEYMLRNTPGFGDLVARMPWGVAPAVSGALSAAIASIVGGRIWRQRQ